MFWEWYNATFFSNVQVIMDRKGQSKNELQTASEGVGSLLQRDYWAVLKACSYSPPELAMLIREKFTAFPPEKLVVFQRRGGKQGPLEAGDELHVNIRMESQTAVRVIHVGAASITLGTAKQHPEAGRITFGAYCNKRDDVIFHIRSRARSNSLTDYTGFMTMGDPMQLNTWTGYIDRLAHMVADGVIGTIHVEEQEVKQKRDDEAMDAPTFIARED